MVKSLPQSATRRSARHHANPDVHRRPVCYAVHTIANAGKNAWTSERAGCNNPRPTDDGRRLTAIRGHTRLQSTTQSWVLREDRDWRRRRIRRCLPLLTVVNGAIGYSDGAGGFPLRSVFTTNGAGDLAFASWNNGWCIQRDAVGDSEAEHHPERQPRASRQMSSDCWGLRLSRRTTSALRRQFPSQGRRLGH